MDAEERFNVVSETVLLTCAAERLGRIREGEASPAIAGQLFGQYMQLALGAIELDEACIRHVVYVASGFFFYKSARYRKPPYGGRYG